MITPFYQDDNATLYTGDCRAVLAALPAQSVQCCVTSPPYYRLRDYGVAGQVGLEPTLEAYVQTMVEVFRAVKRVLRDDGTLWLNLGDSFGVGANLADCLASSIEGGVLSLSAGCTLTITTQSNKILAAHQFLPDEEFTSLFGVQRIFFKQGHNDLCQVLNLLTPKCRVRVGPAVSFMRIGQSDAEIVLEALDHLRIVVTQDDLNTQPPITVPLVSAKTIEDGQAAFAIEKTTEPVAKCLRHLQSAGHAIPQKALCKSRVQIDSVDQAIPLRDAPVSHTQGLRNFRITKASKQHVAFALMDGVVELTVVSVGHLWVSNRFGSLMHYSELYDKAQRKSNTLRSKQELGVPDLVKRALMEDGWICRSTIIWHKPNPMPESVQDRPTKSHEFLFLFTKRPRYFYDHLAIAEPCSERVRKSGVIEATNLQDERFVFRKNGGLQVATTQRSDVPISAFDRDGSLLQLGIRQATAILDLAQLQEQLGLLALDPQIGEQGAHHNARLAVVDTPVIRRAATQATRFTNGDISAKEFLCEMDRLCVALPDGNQLKETWRAALGDAAHINANGNRPISVNNASKISEIGIFHDEEYTIVSSCSSRNKRTVWTIATQAFKGAHFATFPERLVEPCILAGTSQAGCCSVCRKAWVRVVEVAGFDRQRWAPGEDQYHTKAKGRHGATSSFTTGNVAVKRTLGFRPTCPHTDAPAIPCTVLDPFVGSGTALAVAARLGRQAIGIDLSPTYCALAAGRLAQTTASREGVAS